MSAGFRCLAVILLGVAGVPVPAAPPPSLATDRAAIGELISAVSLDVMSEATLQACTDMGVASADRLREAWVAWRQRHQIAPLRQVVQGLRERGSSKLPPWSDLTGPLRERVLADPRVEATCSALLQDWQGPGMDPTTLYPRARAVAAALVQVKVVSAPALPAVAAGTVRGPVLRPSQVPALAAQQQGGWGTRSVEDARREQGLVLVKGRVARRGRDDFQLIEAQGDRESAAYIRLEIDAEPWVGQDVVLRGVFTALRDYGATLADVQLVNDASGLVPSTLPAAPLARREVLLQRVMVAPGKGLKPADLAAVVLHGKANYNNGTSWDEDVRFLLRDGSCYRRSEMPPDQLDVAASRRLEPQQWCRWRQGAKGYEVQDQDDDGRPAGDWTPLPHRAMSPWAPGTAVDGYFSRSRFDGSLAFGGLSSTQGLRLTRDGRFERSQHALGTSGTVAGALNNTVIGSSSHADGRGSSSATTATVGGVGAATRQQQDDGASRRGRYRFEGYAVVLDYDDGHQERLLSFPTGAGLRGLYVGSGSLTAKD